MREAEAVLGRFSVVLGGLGGSVCMCISPGGPCASVCASACARGGAVCVHMRTFDVEKDLTRSAEAVDLGQSRAPNREPRWSQNGAKIGPKTDQNRR